MMEHDVKRDLTSPPNNYEEINQALKNVLELVESEQERDYTTNSDMFDQLLTAFSAQLNTLLVPTSVANDYVGVHLGQLYEDNDFKLLIKSFKNNQVLDAFYALKIITDAKRQLEKMPNIRECLIDDPLEQGVIIVGDLHGNFNDLNHIIHKYGTPGLNYKFIFNGDYVDRGQKQMEVLLTLLYAFLIRPDRVFLNRGNHEDVSMNVRAAFEPNFMNCARSMYGKYGPIVFNTSVDLFRYLPLATVLKNTITDVSFFIVHGGIGHSTDLNHVRNVERRDYFQINHVQVENERQEREKRMLIDLLWSDPIRNENGRLKPSWLTSECGCYFNASRNAGSLFGVDLTRSFCERYGFSSIIRSHQVRDRGYSEDHTKCLTVFSASYYCGGDNYGAVFKLTPASLRPKPHRFKNRLEKGTKTNLIERNNYMIRQFKRVIQSNEDRLLPLLESEDVGRTGRISTQSWANILAGFFQNQIRPDQLILLKDYLCECETTLGLVNYKTLFVKRLNWQPGSRGVNYSGNMLAVLHNLFQILDQDNDNRITVDDAKRVLRILNKRLGEKYSIEDDCNEFIRMFDKNHDNMIDINDFKSAFMEEEYLVSKTVHSDILQNV